MLIEGTLFFQHTLTKLDIQFINFLAGTHCYEIWLKIYSFDTLNY